MLQDGIVGMLPNYIRIYQIILESRGVVGRYQRVMKKHPYGVIGCYSLPTVPRGTVVEASGIVEASREKCRTQPDCNVRSKTVYVFSFGRTL